MLTGLDPAWLATVVVATALPLLLAIGTSFAKSQIVLASLRHALGAGSVPSDLVITAVAAAWTAAVMTPLLEQLPSATTWLSGGVADGWQAPWRAFLLANAGQPELEAALRISGQSAAHADVGVATALMAFSLTELREAFVLSFAVVVPFFVIDLALGATLTVAGLQSVPPSSVAVPLKLLLFGSAGGWLLVSQNLLTGYVFPAAGP
jgi:flagellar biosynthetic protein FliP